MRKILFWLGVFAVSLLVMVRPAAASGPVQPSPGTITYWIINASLYHSDTPAGACTQYITIFWGSLYTFDHVTSANPTYDSWRCFKRTLSSGSVADIGLINMNSTPQVCPLNSSPGAPVSACVCDAGYLPNSDVYAEAHSCVFACPRMYASGLLAVSTGFGLHAGASGNNYSACDQFGCQVNVTSLVNVLGVELVHQSAVALACTAPSSLPATPLTVVLADRASPELTKFDDVVSAAAAVDAAKTEQARADAYIAKVVADGIAAKIAADTAAAQAGVDAQKAAVTEVKRAAGQVTANPTTANVNNYNNAVTIYNNTVSTVGTAMTQLQGDYSVQSANGNNAQGTVTDAAAIKAQIDALKAAITASGLTFNAPSVTAKTTGDTALNSQLTEAIAALAAAQVELAKASALATQAALDIAAAAKSLADTAAAIKALLAGLPGLPPPVPPVPPPPPPPGGPPTPWCVDHPTDPLCKVPDPVDCSVTPNAPGCLSMSGTPEVRTLALSSVYVAGTLNEGKTVGDVLGTFKTRMLSSGVVGAATHFFNVTASAGSCPTWSVNTPMFGTLTFDMYCTSTFQNLLPWIRSVIMLIFSVVAFRIAIL